MIALVAAALYTSTVHVRAVALAGNILWAATSGGVEQYDLASRTRTRLFTTADGLDSNDALAVRFDGNLHVRTATSTCSRIGDTSPDVARFVCRPGPRMSPPELTVAEWHHGARVTQRLRALGQDVIATDGAGLFVGSERLTPPWQLCGNHVSALATFQGALWVGTFDAGLCVLEAGGFRPVATPFRMVNDLQTTPRGLVVAAAEGLYSTADGERFLREPRVRERGANRIAASRHWLFVTTPVALYALRLEGKPVVRRWLKPAGSTALQGVAVSGSNVWLASEDAGAIRLRGDRFEAFDRASGLPSSWLVDVAPAPAGGVWAATLRDGAVQLGSDGRVLKTLADRAWGLRLFNAESGVILFGTQQGIAGWPPEAMPLPDPRVHAFLRAERSVWVGTEGGLALLDGW